MLCDNRSITLLKLASYASSAILVPRRNEERLKDTGHLHKQVLVDCLQEWAPAKVVTRLFSFFKVSTSACVCEGVDMCILASSSIREESSEK